MWLKTRKGGMRTVMQETGKTSNRNLITGATGDWEVVIGLEVHAQVASKAKLFSGASTAFGAAPNSQVSLVDAAMPGMLPVINEALRRAGGAHRARPQGADQPRLASSTARTTSIPTCRRATRSRQYKQPDRRRGRGRGRA